MISRDLAFSRASKAATAPLREDHVGKLSARVDAGSALDARVDSFLLSPSEDPTEQKPSKPRDDEFESLWARQPQNENGKTRKRGPAPFVTKVPLDQRFWAKVGKSDGCWIWTGDKDAHGYGHFLVGSRATKRRLLQAHRVAYELAFGWVPPLLRHLCGQTSCVRPDHLKPGTHAENSADMVAMGRSLIGTRNPSNKLTEDDVRDIFARIQAGESFTTIARSRGICFSAVYQIAKGQMWWTVTGLPRCVRKRDRRKKLPAANDNATPPATHSTEASR